jgi:hypothetical protein
MKISGFILKNLKFNLVPSVNELFRKRRFNDQSQEPNEPRVKRESQNTYAHAADNEHSSDEESPKEAAQGSGEFCDSLGVNGTACLHIIQK